MISLDPTCPNQPAGGGSMSHNCDALLEIAAALRERLSDKGGQIEFKVISGECGEDGERHFG